MREGLFETHIRLIRIVYAARRATLIASLSRHMSDDVKLQPSEGTHLLLWLRKVLTTCNWRRQRLPMLGFGGFEPDELEAAAIRLRCVMDQHTSQRRAKPRRTEASH
ncbi:hypothetical protein [Bradyrhizobium embrapense]|uniref:hypothetical protein n=1 Tax=Bradyrhizobium embrapense TaxID=630921 RepID=UPI00067C8DB6|nr:hypothetical protein [Bradyrhizobium embrapense]